MVFWEGRGFLEIALQLGFTGEHAPMALRARLPAVKSDAVA